MLASGHLYSTTDINIVCELCTTVTMCTSHLPVYTTAVNLSLVLHKILPHSHLFCDIKSSDATLLLGLNVLQQLFFSHFFYFVV
jgi:hypothetical protein